MPELVHIFNMLLAALITILFSYQGVFMLLGFLRSRKTQRYDAPESAEKRRYAAVISARNESAVIGELIASLKGQHYPRELLDIYVVADNCSDDTAQRAQAAGAVVFERFDNEKVGKGYALDFLFSKLHNAGLDAQYSGYFVFDADNLVDPDFVRRMNDTACSGDYDAVTCYRNSKNYGANWISAGYSLWFLREARFLNYPRMILGSNCTVSGTGYLISARVIRENGGWPFHLLTEDLQFSADCTGMGRRIGYCDKAVIYDEQPTSFRQSWHQRLRWTRGFYQVAWHYAPHLIRGMRGKHALSCYDTLMIVAPGSLLTVALMAVNLFVLTACLTQSADTAMTILRTELEFIVGQIVLYYAGFTAVGALTMFCEWNNVRATRTQKILYLFTFGLFMMTYVPIAAAALRRKVEWKPIEHHASGGIHAMAQVSRNRTAKRQRKRAAEKIFTNLKKIDAFF